MAFDTPSYETVCRNVAYEIESRNFIKMNLNGQKLHESTSALIEQHPSIVRGYIEKYGVMATVQGLNTVFKRAVKEKRLVGCGEMQSSIESRVE